jgi:HlyD family secretion protein
MRGTLKTILILVVLLGVAGGAYAWYKKANDTGPAQYRTVAVKHGEMVATISATGTLEPEDVIDVGAQVAGQILAFGTDEKTGKPVDYRSMVKKDEVLAQIDPQVYKSDLQSAQAQLDSAKANVGLAQANVDAAKAKLVQANADWERAQHAGQGALAQADIDKYKAVYETAVAQVTVSQKTVIQAEKAVAQAQAATDKAVVNLGYCTIKSPVDGTIIDRRVNIGQTVVSSLNAPSLFLIAQDLTKMQVWASVNEADIGSIHEGQKVTFTADAFPGRTFEGSVNKVRLNATMTQNVVTYTVEINAPNPDNTLLPYLTANVLFEVARKNDTLLVPNAALRWTPASPELIAPEARAAMSARGAGAGPAGPGGGAMRGGRGGQAEGGGEGAPASAGSKKHNGEQHHGTLWVQDGEFVKPIRVATGLTDGLNTEIILDDKNKDEIGDGTEVITGEARPEDVASGEVSNPFAPKFGRKKK